jgi:L-amino acid N-acyltransferase YncA
MTEHVRFRAATGADAVAILGIYGPYIERSGVSFETSVPSLVEMEQRIVSGSKLYPWLVAELNSTVVGYAYASAHRVREAYQWAAEVSTYVNDTARNLGIATRLYQTLFDTLKRQNVYHALAGITQPNAPSVSFHLSMGFREVATYTNVGYKMGQWHTTKWYQLVIKETLDPPEPFVPLAHLTESLDH